MKFEVFKLCLVIGIGIATMGVQIASGLLTCDTTDPDSDLSQCFKDTFIDLNSTWSVGIPDLDIPPMDPFGFDGISLDGGSAVVDFAGSFSNIVIRGISQFSNVGVVLNTVAHTVNFTIAYPLIYVNGTYSATGHVIPVLLGPIVPVSGSGSFWFRFVGPQLTGGCSLSNGTDGTVTFLVLSDCVLDITFSDYSFELSNLGGALLGPIVNSALYLGRNVIWMQLEPEINSKAAELIPVMFNDFLQTQAYLSAILK